MLTNKSQNKTKKPTKKRKKTKCTAPEDSEEEDWPCIICGESFRNCRSREKWIQCVYLAKNGPIMSVLHKLDAHLYVLTVTVMTIFSLNFPLSMIINKTDKYT